MDHDDDKAAPTTAPTMFKCAGPSCPGLPYKASEIGHPASCAEPLPTAPELRPPRDDEPIAGTWQFGELGPRVITLGRDQVAKLPGGAQVVLPAGTELREADKATVEGELHAPAGAWKQILVNDLLTPVHGGHVVAGPWERYENATDARCAACGFTIELRRSADVASRIKVHCRGWSSRAPNDVLERVVAGITRDRLEGAAPNGPAEVATDKLGAAIGDLCGVAVSAVPDAAKMNAGGIAAMQAFSVQCSTLSDMLLALQLALDAPVPRLTLDALATLAGAVALRSTNRKGPGADDDARKLRVAAHMIAGVAGTNLASVCPVCRDSSAPDVQHITPELHMAAFHAAQIGPEEALHDFLAALPGSSPAGELGPVEAALFALDNAIAEVGCTDVAPLENAANNLRGVIHDRLREVATFALAWRDAAREHARYDWAQLPELLAALAILFTLGSDVSPVRRTRDAWARFTKAGPVGTRAGTVEAVALRPLVRGQIVRPGDIEIARGDSPLGPDSHDSRSPRSDRGHTCPPGFEEDAARAAEKAARKRAK